MIPFLKRWFELFSWLAGIYLIAAFIFDETLTRSTCLIPLGVSFCFSLVPDSVWEKLRAQIRKS